MSAHEDVLLEIQTEELPPKALLNLGSALKQEMEKQLQKANLAFGESQVYLTPRRLALYIKAVASAQAAQTVERKGPALNAAYDKEGKPTPACLGFARSCGIEPKALKIIKNPGGEWVGYVEEQPGKDTVALLPAMVQQALATLPIPKRMRWGTNTDSFIRPVHSAILLFGKNIVETTLLGKPTQRETAGHRFHHPASVKITQPKDYEATLAKKAYIIADFDKRKALIKEGAEALVQKQLGPKAKILFQEALLNEVTGLVEWPLVICGQFDAHFLKLPREVLISAMQDHQRYFPLEDEQGHLLPHFVAAINIESQDVLRVVAGNERVLRARLSDAAFFYETDKKRRLEERTEDLKGIVFQAKLGTLYDKTERLIQLANYLAPLLKEKETLATRAAFLAKADLTTGMVGEFPELQGIMGSYYALHDREPQAVAEAIVDHYKPRFSGDDLPRHTLGSIIALADRVDTLVGVFGLNQGPTGDKDPYGLRRAALGVLRILIEKEIDIDLSSLLAMALKGYGSLENQETVSQVLRFIFERMKGRYQEKDADAFASVMAIKVTNPYDAHRRIEGIQAFKTLPQAEALALANKRVSNILAQYKDKLSATEINPQLFEDEAEQVLFERLKEKSQQPLKAREDYSQVMLRLAELREPIDQFFDRVMVMAEDKKVRENRLLLLSQLRTLFLQVADIALLVTK
jgi:glycyl-tRNA synthetase beta chain